MYAAYPELRGNLDLLRTNATYADDETYVYIYKNHFLHYLEWIRSIRLNKSKTRLPLSVITQEIRNHNEH